jgi:hypothetical protein
LREARIETKDPEIELWDFDELCNFLKGKKVSKITCGIADVPNNYFVQIVNAITKISSQDIFFQSSNAALTIEKKGCKSITVRFNNSTEKLESVDIQTGKYGWINLVL